ncbi:MAG: polysaccharide deacetylase family protein [bacterium]
MEAARNKPPAILLSFDAEEFDTPGDFGRAVDPAQAIATGAAGCNCVLDGVKRVGVPATFFTTASLAQARPELLRRIVGEGHELASHGWTHTGWSSGDPGRARAALEKISGVPVHGFRRARFMATDAALLKAAGYRYDSSENPVWIPGRYNNYRRPRTPWLDHGLFRIPVSATPGVRLPLFWLSFKNFPFAFYLQLARQTLRHDGYLALVFHPWEFTDLASTGLPRYISRPDGVRLWQRLERLLAALAPGARFMTYNDWVVEAFHIPPES